MTLRRRAAKKHALRCGWKTRSELYNRRRPRSEPIIPPPSLTEAHSSPSRPPTTLRRRYTPHPSSRLRDRRPTVETSRRHTGTSLPCPRGADPMVDPPGLRRGPLGAQRRGPDVVAQGFPPGRGRGGASHNRSQPRNGLGLERNTTRMDVVGDHPWQRDETTHPGKKGEKGREEKGGRRIDGLLLLGLSRINLRMVFVLCPTLQS